MYKCSYGLVYPRVYIITTENMNDNSEGWGSWLTQKVPWAKERAARQNREQQRDTNAAVANVSQNLSDLKKKRRFLGIKMEKLRSRAMAPGTTENDAQRLAGEYSNLQNQIQQLDGILRNVQGINVAIDTTSTNVQAFNAMQDAQRGMQDMVQQVQPDDVDEVMENLQCDMDSSQQMSRAMTQPLDWGNTNAYQDHMQSSADQAAADLLSGWRNEIQVGDLPAAPRGTVQRTVQHDNNNSSDPVRKMDETFRGPVQ